MIKSVDPQLDHSLNHIPDSTTPAAPASLEFCLVGKTGSSRRAALTRELVRSISEFRGKASRSYYRSR